MGRFYKTHTRWMSDTPVKKASPVIVDVVEVSPSLKDLNTSEEAVKAHVEPPKSDVSEKSVEKSVEAPKPEEVAAESSTAMIIEKRETEKGTMCTITADLDYDEIRYNVGSKKVTEKNKSRCKLYEGEFVLEEPGVVNASAFKEGVLVCSVQG